MTMSSICSTKTAISASDPADLLAAVLKANERTTDDRLREILNALIRHVHAFALDIDLSPSELEYGLNFLVRIGQASGPRNTKAFFLPTSSGSRPWSSYGGLDTHSSWGVRSPR